MNKNVWNVFKLTKFVSLSSSLSQFHIFVSITIACLLEMGVLGRGRRPDQGHTVAQPADARGDWVFASILGKTAVYSERAGPDIRR
jgi:hypothetical protein